VSRSANLEYRVEGGRLNMTSRQRLAYTRWRRQSFLPQLPMRLDHTGKLVLIDIHHDGTGSGWLTTARAKEHRAEAYRELAKRQKIASGKRPR
jgi:hypothetical protein